MLFGIDALEFAGIFGLGLTLGLLLQALVRGPLGSVGAAVRALPAVVRYGSVGLIAAVSVALLAGRDGTTVPDRTVDTVATSKPKASMGSSQGSAGSMEAATAALADRLAAKGGSDQDWELLAQSYDFLGRKAEAQQARQHKLSPQRSLQDSVAMSTWLVAGARPAAPAGNPAAALLAQAEQHRRKREFRQACDVYRQVIAAHGMTADAWADYADALASAQPSGSLRGEPAKAIEQSLALDPKNPKALWLKASLAHEEQRYGDALGAWQQLLALVAPGSSDARIIEANIAEDRRLAGGRS